MTTKEVMNLDYRKEETKEIIQKVLRQIKPLSKYSDEDEVPFNALEKIITIMCKKYCVRIQELIPDVLSNDRNIIWRAKLINESNLEVIDIIYGISIYEVFAKTTIRLYTEVKKKGTKTRN